MGSRLQCISWGSTSRLKGAAHRLGQQLCKLLVRKHKFVRHQWRNEEKSREKSTQQINLCSQAQISTHQMVFAQHFQIGFEALHPLCIGSTAMLTVCQLP